MAGSKNRHGNMLRYFSFIHPFRRDNSGRLIIWRNVYRTMFKNPETNRK